MLKKFIFSSILSLFYVISASGADAVDSEGRVIMYIRGDMTGQWSARNEYKMSRVGDTYSITLPSLDGEFKVAGTEWQINYGNNKPLEKLDIDDAMTFYAARNGANFIAHNLTDVTIRFDMPQNAPASTIIYISANGKTAPVSPGQLAVSGTLPVLYINIRNEDGSFNNEVIDRNLSHKDYFAGEYWLDLNGCTWLEELGAESIGSAEEPLTLEIKARGNFTRQAFAKKPFKLKLGSKQEMLGLSKSKHFALLAHSDDNCGYLRNFTGFNLGRRIGLPWTPWQQPVEVIINGDYRGLYFLTESIRVDKDRVNIKELADNETDGKLISGGYLIELDNYDEENQIRLTEKSCVSNHYLDALRITWDTPEQYSELQKQFVTDQFTAMNNYIGSNSDNVWKYLDLDDAARYYLVEEIISHVEAYHGSTYMYRDFGKGKKWHFSPLWDCGNAFNGSDHEFFYNNDPFGNTWIPSMRENKTFNDKVKATWLWFMNNGYVGLIDDIDEYISHISEAAKADRSRWKDAPRPDFGGAMDVADNTNMAEKRERVVNHLNNKINWLKEKFGNFEAYPDAPEPERDTTPAAELPAYADPDQSYVESVDYESVNEDAQFFNLQGMKIAHPIAGEVYIRIVNGKASKVILRNDTL